MVFGVILAGGIGSRMGADKPKQFLLVGGKPILIHTIEKFAFFPGLEEVIVLTPREWIEYTKDIVEKHISEECIKKVHIIEGGIVRNETIMNAIQFIENEGKLDEDTIIVTHDAVRPFVTHRIIQENIEAAKKYGATDTVIPATDTIVESKDGRSIVQIPDRGNLYQGQTPQSFKAKELRETYNSLREDEKERLTDATKIYVLKNKNVCMVNGEVFNIKVTYPYDLTVAEALLKNGIC